MNRQGHRRSPHTVFPKSLPFSEIRTPNRPPILLHVSEIENQRKPKSSACFLKNLCMFFSKALHVFSKSSACFYQKPRIFRRKPPHGFSRHTTPSPPPLRHLKKPVQEAIPTQARLFSIAPIGGTLYLFVRSTSCAQPRSRYTPPKRDAPGFQDSFRANPEPPAPAPSCDNGHTRCHRSPPKIQSSLVYPPP